MSDTLVRSRQTAAKRRALVCGDLVVEHAHARRALRAGRRCAQGSRAATRRSDRRAGRQLSPLRRAVLRRAVRRHGPRAVEHTVGASGARRHRARRPPGAAGHRSRCPRAARRGRPRGDDGRVGRARRRGAAGSPRPPRPRGGPRTPLLHERHDRTPEGRDADASQPGRQRAAQDDRLRPAGRGRVPRRGPVLPRRRYGTGAVADLAGWVARRAPFLRGCRLPGHDRAVRRDRGDARPDDARRPRRGAVDVPSRHVVAAAHRARRLTDHDVPDPAGPRGLPARRARPVLRGDGDGGDRHLPGPRGAPPRRRTPRLVRPTRRRRGGRGARRAPGGRAHRATPGRSSSVVRT